MWKSLKRKIDNIFEMLSDFLLAKRVVSNALENDRRRALRQRKGMKESMRRLLALLGRQYDIASQKELPLHTSIFRLQGYWDSVREKDECKKNLKELEEKGWIHLHSDPFTTAGKYCGKIFDFIPEPRYHWDRTITKDPIKQEMLDKVFSEVLRRGEEYSPEIRKEILRGYINEHFFYHGSKISNTFLENVGEGDWPPIMSALREWESEGLLKILKDPQAAHWKEDCIEILQRID